MQRRTLNQEKQLRRAAAATAAACLLAAAAAAATATPTPSLARAGLNVAGLPLLTPSKFTMFGRPVLYEVPVRPVGTLALFHGCAHVAADFWPRQAACPDCNGLPEELAHTKQALARGYAVLAIDTAVPRACFGIHADQADVVAILKYWLAAQGLESKPLYAAGVSSGAAFALKLPMAMRSPPVRGVISEVLGVLVDSWNMDVLAAAYPPAAFISMPLDARTAQRIDMDMALLRQYGVPTDVILVHPQPVTPGFLSNRSELISLEVAAKASQLQRLVQLRESAVQGRRLLSALMAMTGLDSSGTVMVTSALRAIGMTNADGYLTLDPRSAPLPWRQSLAEMVPELAAASDSLAPDASHIGEELNRALAGHEIVGDYVTACLAWLESQGSLPLNGLAGQFAAAGLPSARLRDLSPQRLPMLPMRARNTVAAALRAHSGSGGAASISTGPYMYVR